MNKSNQNINLLKVAAGFLACLFFRLMPFRAPNIEPILAASMPYSKVYGYYIAILFPFISIIAYDVITGTVGVWTVFTSLSYAIVGLGSAIYFKKYKATKAHFASFSIIGTLFYDAMTGLTVGPLFFGQSFSGALLGQIPFTAMHLIGNVGFAVTISPLLYMYLKKRPEENKLKIKNIINTPKAV